MKVAKQEASNKPGDYSLTLPVFPFACETSPLSNLGKVVTRTQCQYLTFTPARVNKARRDVTHHSYTPAVVMAPRGTAS